MPVTIKYNSIETLVYMTHINKYNLWLLHRQFCKVVDNEEVTMIPMSQSPNILFPCTFVNIRFLHTVFVEGAGCWSSVHSFVHLFCIL